MTKKGNESPVDTMWTIGQAAKAVGVNVQTLRYYERQRLLAPAARTSSSYRMYDTDAIRRLRFIKNGQALGFTLQEIADLLSLRVHAKARCGDVQRRAEAKLRQVQEKILQLQALDQALQHLVHACRSQQPTNRCPILNALEHQEGQVARVPKVRRKVRR